MVKQALLVLASAVSLVGVVVVFRATTIPSRQIRVDPVELADVDAAAAAARLAGAIRFQTISHAGGERFDAREFVALEAYLAEQYPRIRAELEREEVNQFTALYSWPGSEPDLEPVVLMGHVDTVPVVPGTEERWEHPPFGGVIADGYVWGRGALDDKFTVLGVMEAVELLLERGFRPKRTIYLAFGHDEEIGGNEGAARVAALLERRGVRAHMVLDEGGAIVRGDIPGIDRPVATIGIAEKGSISLSLRARHEGGHSSVPPKHTAIGVVATGIHRLERRQMPAGLRDATRSLFEVLAPEMPFHYRVVFANLWLFSPLIEYVLEQIPAGSAMLRTTTAVTVVAGGVKSNVLPTDAEAIVNFRTMPGDTGEVVMEHVEATLADPRIEVTVEEGAREATPISPYDTRAFVELAEAIREVYPQALVAPYMTLGGTDARHFAGVSDHIYRFSPMVGDRADLARMHGLNERTGVEDYGRAIQFYVRLIERF